VTPDGKVLVYTGLLYRCECEDDLAVILGHEIAHVVAAHRDEVRSLFILFNIATAPIAILFWPLLALEYFDWDIGPLEYVLLPYSFAYTMAVSHIERACESEADYIGLVIMSYVGYDIRRAPDFFQTAVLDYDQLHRFYLHEFRLLDEGLLDEDEDEDNDKDGGGDRDDKEQESESVVNKVRERLSKLTSSHPPVTSPEQLLGGELDANRL
jgi:Zn-dependent protease with chaperone function